MAAATVVPCGATVAPTDGLTGVVGDDTIINELTVCMGLGPQEAAGRLVEIAVEAGTRDDTTVVVVDVGSASR